MGLARATCIAACLVVPGRAQAQSVPRNGGPERWLTIGVSAGFIKLACDSCPVSGRTFGPGAQIGVGVAPSRNLRLGIEAILWSKLIADDGADAKLGALSLLGTYFPMDTSGLFLRGGVGAEQYNGGGRQRAMAFQVGVGYEIHSTSALIGSPFVGYLRSVGGRQTARRTVLVDGQATAITETRKVDASLIRVGLDWQWGGRGSGAAR